MKISKKTEYGLRAMIYLAKNEGKVLPLSDISKKEKIPFHFLEKILLKLKKFGLVKAKKGFSGGYFLAEKPSQIKVGKIMKALGENQPLVECLQYFCPRATNCLAKNFWQRLNKAIDSVLNSITLIDLIKKR